MRLTQDWIDRYDEQGFLVFPGLLDAAELEVIDGAQIVSRRRLLG